MQEIWNKLYKTGEPEAAEFGAAGASIEQLIQNGCAGREDLPLLTTLLPGDHSATINFAQFDGCSRAFASYLQQLTLPEDSVVAIQAPNCIAYAICAIGVARAGYTLSNINPLYTVVETNRQLVDCGANVLVICDLFAEKVAQSISNTQVIKVISLPVLFGFSTFKRMVLKTALLFKGMLPKLKLPHTLLEDALRTGSKHQLVPPTSDLDRPLLYQYSGGTTGHPKGVIISERNLMTNLAQGTSFNRTALEEPDQVIMLVMPLYHMFGLFMCLTSIRYGAHLVLVPNPRPLANLKPGFTRLGTTIFPGVNTLFSALLDEPWFKSHPPRLSLTLTGATPLHPDVAARWRQVTNSQLIESYGMTESTTVLTSNPPDERFRERSVGFPLPGGQVKIVDDDGIELPAGEPGEILAKGPQIVKGYLNQPTENKNAFFDGWLKTGDVGYLDQDGYLFIVDRKKDMIAVGGFNVFPIEVETVLDQHPDIIESGVIGISDDQANEKVAAFIVAGGRRPSDEELISWCKESLTPYKCPRIFDFVDALPKSPVGKLLRRELRSLDSES